MPFSAGGYFDKIACFCFELQVLAPGERVEMPVTFFVDPAMLDDRETARRRPRSRSPTPCTRPTCPRTTASAAAGDDRRLAAAPAGRPTIER